MYSCHHLVLHHHFSVVEILGKRSNKVLLRAHPPNFPKQQAPRGFWVAKLNHHGAFTTPIGVVNAPRSEEHTSELQSRFDLVCRLLLEKKKRKDNKRKQTDKTQHDA